jgi:hypothetical protein
VRSPRKIKQSLRTHQRLYPNLMRINADPKVWSVTTQKSLARERPCFQGIKKQEVED